MLNRNIQIVEEKAIEHKKASESYIHVIFHYPSKDWDGFIPVEYRRTGISVNVEKKEELEEYLNNLYLKMNPENYEKWKSEQLEWWRNEKSSAAVTRAFFDALLDGKWKCSQCQLPSNRNYARRIQDIKEFGYTIATDTKRYCPHCNKNTTHLILLPIPRGGREGNGYETWSPELRKRILSVLKNFDVYEYRYDKNCLPDHKFPEIRWDEKTKEENSNSMSDEEIRAKFQLLTNQRNQQKREVCRTCFQTKVRGEIFGIPFFYQGKKEWDKDIPETGKEAEKGCIGCPWYDIDAWRKALINKLENHC